MQSVLSVHGVSKTYPGVIALRDVSFSLAPGEIRALCGENGAGKSTFVKILMGIIQPDSGSIAINGKVLQGLSGCARFNGLGCWISAVDIATGKLAWKFNVIAQEGTPGGDTWGTLSNMFRAGGETWIAGSYDPTLNLTYWGTAQAKPWVQASRGTGPDDRALFSSATLALRRQKS